MEIKRIQLRGISRSPSDRLTEDGGVAESLNIHLDNTECAPVMQPEDVTSKLGLPDGLQADYVFVHKTASYENIIVYSDGCVQAYDQNGNKISSLVVNGGKINSIISLGNTLIFFAEHETYYALFRDNRYVNLGGRIPFPELYIEGAGQAGSKTVSIDLDELGVYGLYRAFGEEYDSYKADHTNADESVQKILSAINEQKVILAGELGSGGYFWGPTVVMYGITLYDGSVITTTPELLFRKSSSFGGRTWNMSLSSKYTKDGTKKEFVGGIDALINAEAYSIHATTKEAYDISEWKDVIKSIDIYVSSPVDTAQNYRRVEITEVIDEDSLVSDKTTRTAYTKWGILDEENELLSKGVFYRLKSFDLRELEENAMQINWSSIGSDVSETSLATAPFRIPSDGISHQFIDANKIVAKNGFLFNDTLILSGVTNIFNYSGCRVVYNTPATYTAKIKFILHDGAVVYSDNETSFNMPGFLMFPRKGVVRMEAIVKRQRRAYNQEDEAYETVTEFSYLTLPMSDHLNILCSYAYIGITKNFAEYAFEKNGVVTLEEANKAVNFSIPASPSLYEGNKLYLSTMSNPFVFPVEKRKTLQSNIIGIAVAATTLSQGQFGQFPLYVFTEDGIWAMETGTDGSFISSKPLSRDVCTNPQSITSIDKAVVFVTDQGVMILEGSQVANISPYMNGRHYAIENTARTIIDGLDFFCDLLPALTDNTHFMSFVKQASVAYDYAGQRLIFIKPDEKYQYVYKLDTQTWHKAAYEARLITPVNSYPICMVQGEGNKIAQKLLTIIEDNAQAPKTEIAQSISNIIGLNYSEVLSFLNKESLLDITTLSEDDLEWLYVELHETNQIATEVIEKYETRVYDLTTLLDAAETKTSMRGVIATRPFDLDAPDVYKSIKDVRVRGQFPKGAVKFILLGSNDGIGFNVINTLRGKAWKLFRLIILADLDPTDRISWVDIQYETRFTNKLR